jgi:SAM-dependent methyltransferase
MSDYAFGDSELAADRLARLARLFAPAMESILGQVPITPSHVVDLGCGPGHTTRMLAERWPGATVTGFDASLAYVERARARGVDAIQADVTGPLPDSRPYDLAYARFLLAHLGNGPTAVELWCRGLSTRGCLVLEETESIASDDPDFARYEAISRGVVQSRGAPLYAGPLIARIEAPTAFERTLDRVVDIDLTAGEAASLFWRNIPNWAERAVDERLASRDELDALGDRLRAREADNQRGCFEWRQRQTIIAASGISSVEVA